VATTLVVVWASTANANLDAMGYVSRAGTFVLLGGLLGIFADRLRAAALRAERAQTRSVLILESSGDAIYEVRGDGRLAYANPVAVALTGWEAAELAGKDAHATFHHSRADGAVSASGVSDSGDAARRQTATCRRRGVLDALGGRDRGRVHRIADDDR
jgi:PAS domain-containing protein